MLPDNLIQIAGNTGSTSMFFQLDDSDLGRVRRSIFLVFLLSAYVWWFNPSLDATEVFGLRSNPHSPVPPIVLHGFLFIVTGYLALKFWLLSRASSAAFMSAASLEQKVALSKGIKECIEGNQGRLESYQLRLSDLGDQLKFRSKDLQSNLDAADATLKKVMGKIAELQSSMDIVVAEERLINYIEDSARIERETAMPSSQGPSAGSVRENTISLEKLKDLIRSTNQQPGDLRYSRQKIEEQIGKANRSIATARELVEETADYVTRLENSCAGRNGNLQKYLESEDRLKSESFVIEVYEDVKRFSDAQVPVRQDFLLSIGATWMMVVGALGLSCWKIFDYLYA